MEEKCQKPRKEKLRKKRAKGLGFPLAAITLLAFLLGAGLGFSTGGSGADGSAAELPRQPQKEASSQTLPTQSPATQSTAETQLKQLDVCVVGNDYFYQNKRLTLAELLEQLERVEGAFIVVITEDNASLKAYNGLADALRENGISYIFQ